MSIRISWSVIFLICSSWLLPAQICGDVNNSGVVGEEDLLALKNYLNESVQAGEGCFPNIGNADVNHDGVVDIVDAMLLSLYLDGDLSSLDCGSDQWHGGDLYAFDSIVGNLRYVPAGTFVQGSPEDEPCRDPGVSSDENQFTHTLTRSLAVMETEVTRQMWADLKAVQPILTVIPLMNPTAFGMNHPVEGVTWYQAVLFANLLSVQQELAPCYYTDETMATPIDSTNYDGHDYMYCNFHASGYRLPTEGEWEYICRAGTIGPFWIDEPNYDSTTCRLDSSCNEGTLPNLEDAAWFCANMHDPAGNDTSKPVGLKKANPWGLRDTHGNVYEWCWDWYENHWNFPGSVTDYNGPHFHYGPSPRRVIRGGDWDSTARYCRSGVRKGSTPTIGFRLIRTAKCTHPIITVHPKSQTIQNGQPAQLSVMATGTNTLKYEWFKGTKGKTLTPVGTDSNIYGTPALFETACYWVRVSNECGEVDSNTAAIIVSSSEWVNGDIVEDNLLVGNLYFVSADIFPQGSPLDEPCSNPDETPFTHALTQNLAVMGTEVTRQMWADLKTAQPTLPDDPTDTSSGMENPVQKVTWYETVLFANLLSLEQGLTPCYYTSASFQTPIDLANYSASTVYCKFHASGYRLPTEGEWEYFCRAGTTGPFWVDEPDYTLYTCESCLDGDLPNLENVAVFCANTVGGTSPVASKDANPWGLHDVHGNVEEWCWDQYSSSYPSENAADYKGPENGSLRVIRGGSSSSTANHCRSASRNRGLPGQLGQPRSAGFRLVRKMTTQEYPTVAMKEGQDYSLPSWVTPDPYSGYSGTSRPGGRIALKHWLVSWRDLEPNRGAYNWNLVEDEMSLARERDYKLTMYLQSIVLGGGSDELGVTIQNSVPDWVMEEINPAMDTLGGLFDLEVIPGWQPEIRDAFNNLIRAFGEQGFPQREELGMAYIHGISQSLGEEFGLDQGIASQVENSLGFSREICTNWIQSRIDAYADAFTGATHKLAWVGGSNTFSYGNYGGMAWELVQYAWEKGAGSRNGIVERYHSGVNDEAFGQEVDEQGYLTVDESIPPIATARYFGEENEEYGENWIWRYGPQEGDEARYRMSIFRTLQMRIKFLWTWDAAEEINPPLSEYARLSFGKNPETSADAWVYLKESPVSFSQSPTGVLKNFERWLIQRDIPGGMTIPTERKYRAFDAGYSPPDMWYDDLSRSTNLATGNIYIYFELDDRFQINGPVNIKVEFIDNTNATWYLEYMDADSTITSSQDVKNLIDGKIKTATFHIPNIQFGNMFDSGMDFRIVCDGPEDINIRWVRVIREDLSASQ